MPLTGYGIHNLPYGVFRHAARAEFAIGFGSCSFEEPVADLRTIGLLACRAEPRSAAGDYSIGRTSRTTRPCH